MATLTVYPQAGSGGSNVSCDGYIRYNPTDVSWSALVTASTGTAVNLTEGSPTTSVGAGTGGTTNTFNLNCRYYWSFDTSALGVSAKITALTLSLFGISKASGIGTTNFHVIQSTQANANTLATSDYSAVGNTDFGSIALASVSTSAYNIITLNSNGIANVNVSGVSKFAMVSEWDLNQNFTGTWSGSTFTGFEAFMSDIGTTSEEPALTITYSFSLIPVIVTSNSPQPNLGVNIIMG